MRYAFFALLPDSSAATRAFCSRPAERLAAEGHSTDIFLPASTRLLGWSKRSASRKVVVWVWVFLRRLCQILRASGCDVVFVQRGLWFVSAPPTLERILWSLAKLRGALVIYHLDDALYLSANYVRYAQRCRLASVVTSGNRAIREFAAAQGANVGVLEGPVDAPRYIVREHRPLCEVKLVWVGTLVDEYVRPILSVLEEVHRRTGATFVCACERIPSWSDALPWMRPLVWERSYEFTLLGACDIGIMPLEDTPYNEAKEAYKIKEYMAGGLPVVASPVGHNCDIVDHGVTGFLAEGGEDWIECLVRLVEDPELRRLMGAAGRARVVERWSYETFERQLGEVVYGYAPPSSS